MTLKDLLEHAHLDALGLLDERDKAAFEAALATAPAGVRAQVRSEQARWATMETLLPDAEPPAELRERVLDAVHEAILERSGQALALSGVKRVSPWWRVGAISMLAAAAVLGFAFVSVYTSYQSVTRDNGVFGERMLSVIGTGTETRDIFYNPSTVHRVFENVAAGEFNGQAALYSNPDWPSAKIVCSLPAKEGLVYRVVLLDAQGNVADELIEAASGVNTAVNIGRRVAPGSRIAIASVARGSAVRTSDLLLVVTV